MLRSFTEGGNNLVLPSGITVGATVAKRTGSLLVFHTAATQDNIGVRSFV